MFLEDIYLRPSTRGKGAGRALYDAVAQVRHSSQPNTQYRTLPCCSNVFTLAPQQSDAAAKRMVFWCLGWNEPALRFYKKTGARNVTDADGVRVFAIDQDGLKKL